MSRKLLLTLLLPVVVTLTASFGIASFAFGSSDPPRLRSDLPVAALPAFALDEAESVRINNLIAAPGVERFGITAASYTQVRRLADTRIGTFYLIPGSRGACVVIPDAAACGDPGAPGQPMIALAGATPEGDAVVGAGIATAATKRVVLQRRGGSPMASLPVVRGVFVLTERAGVKPELLRGLRFVAH
jgi:hypothetical protein